MTKTKAPKRRKIASLERKKARAGWIFVLPFVIGFILIYLPIIFDSIKFTFFEMTNVPNYKGGGYILEFVGIENYYNALFVDPDFVQTLITGLEKLIFDIPMILIFSLFMAVLLNQKMAGRAVFRAIFFVPVIISTGLMADISEQNMLMQTMDSAEGIASGTGSSAASEIVSAMDFQQLFANMAVGEELLNYVVTAINNIYDIVNRSGVQMLIFLAGLQSISPAIYESVQIDGATAWETFWKITFPMISPMILVNAVYTVIDSFTLQENAVMKWIGSLKDVTDGVRSSMYWMYFLSVVLIIAAVAGLISAFVFYQKRD